MRFADVLMTAATGAGGRDLDLALWMAAVVTNGGTAAASFWQGEISAIVVWEGTLSDLEKQYLYLWGATRLGLRL